MLENIIVIAFFISGLVLIIGFVLMCVFLELGNTFKKDYSGAAENAAILVLAGFMVCALCLFVLGTLKLFEILM